MSRSTSRKNRHPHHRSGGGPSAIPVSDYESDAVEQHTAVEASLAEVSASASILIPRVENDDLNWRVLKRYLPDMRAILAIAANVVVYNFVNEQNSWEKSGSEGTMFVVELEPVVVLDAQQKQHVIPQNCIYILNRKSMVNFMIKLGDATECEDLGELVVLRVKDQDASAEEADVAEKKVKVIGLWIHPDKVNTREINTSIILAAWKQTRDTGKECLESATASSIPSAASALNTEDPSLATESGTQAKQSGRRLSITELFGQRIMPV